MAHPLARPTPQRGPRWWKDHTPRGTVDDASLDLTARDARTLQRGGSLFRTVRAPGDREVTCYSVTLERLYYPSRAALCLRLTDLIRGRPQLRAGDPVATVDIEMARCRFGGVRCWLRCPQCGTRRRAVYALWPGDPLACRVCLGLAYPSQRQTPRTRWKTKVARLAYRFGIDAASPSLASKPPRMHWRTFRRLLGAVNGDRPAGRSVAARTKRSAQPNSRRTGSPRARP
jgi:hypothetical protein